MSNADQSLNDEMLFQQSFHEWLSVNGVILGDFMPESKSFSATIDLNKLMLGIMKLKGDKDMDVYNDFENGRSSND